MALTLSQIGAGNYNVVSTPKYGGGNMNNPLNVKVGSDTQKYIANGQAKVGPEATDGGHFLAFNDRNAGVNAAKDLLFSSGVYKGLTVDQALKKWSNNGYGGNLVPSLAKTSIDSLTPDQQTQVLNAMETKGENDAIPKGTLTLSQLKPGSYQVTGNTNDQRPAIPPAVPPQGALAKANDAFNQFSQGVAKGELKQVGNLGTLVDKGLGMLPGAAGKFFAGGAQEGTKDVASPALQDKGAAQTAGDITSIVAPYFTGVGEEEGAATLARLFPKIAESIGTDAETLLPKVASYLAKKLPAIASDTAVGTAQTGSPKEGAQIGIGGELMRGAGATVKGVGEGVAKMFIPTSEKEAGLLQAYKAGNSLPSRIAAVLGFGSKKAPTTAAQTAFDKGLIGGESLLGIQAKRAQTKLWNSVVAPALNQSKVTVDMPSFLGEAATKIKSEVDDPTRQKVLLNALESIKEDFSGIGEVPLKKLQKYKEDWAEFVPEKAYKGEPIAGALNSVRDTLADMARSKIYASLGDNVKQAYFDYGNLHSLTALGRKAMAGSKFKGGAGSFIHALWEKATVPAGTIGGQTLYKIGNGMEIVGAPGAKTLGEALGILSPGSSYPSSQNQTNDIPSANVSIDSSGMTATNPVPNLPPNPTQQVPAMPPPPTQ